MSQAKNAQKKSGGFDWTILVIPVALIVSELVFHYVFGARGNFVDDECKTPIPLSTSFSKHYMGLMYQGGFIVPFLLTMTITVITFTIERLLTISKAQGTGSLETFLQRVKTQLHNNDIKGALAECDKQRGSVANVVVAGLGKYQEMEANTTFTLEQKVQHIQQEVEEATSLELPGLQENLPILATIASVATLFALLGTVLGMIRAFSALGESGNPDPGALATGIAEALVNTALGIGTSAFAIMLYNYFTSKIDKLTYGIDELGYSIAQTFASTKK